jgi:hypothetical protein
MANLLADIAASLGSPVEQRLFIEYGAVFVTTATPPPVIIFDDEAQVEEFQTSLTLGRGFFGEYEVQLQSVALDALASAAAEMIHRGGRITARASDAGGRSYADTVSLWARNVTRGLEHWQGLGRITMQQGQSIGDLNPVDQVSAILDLEETEQLYFGTFFDRSILYSVAAPGASQHLAMLAFDVTEYEDRDIRQCLADTAGIGLCLTTFRISPFLVATRVHFQRWVCGGSSALTANGCTVFGLLTPTDC